MSTPLKVDTARVKDYFLTLQESIVSGLEALDGAPFQTDRWTREQGGGGVSRLLENGQVFERAGVLFSHVMGDTLPASATSHRPAVAGRRWEAMGVSLVLHPDNPFVPTTHMNVRMFVAYAHPSREDPDIFWFGGGMDLTPYYVFEEDAKHFHQSCYDALNAHDPELYPAYKAWCDEYFYLKHRQETRGVGGVFFDDLNEPGFEESFAITRSVGDAFLGAYQPIVEKRHHLPFKPSHKDFQHYRRGRYVEFNLVFDRGTLFGLQSGGRTESILMSMPPVVNWRYDWHPTPGSEEAKLYEYLTPKDWLACE